MSDVVLLSGTPLKPPAGGKVLIYTDAGTQAGAMMAIAPRDSFEDLVLGFSFFEEESGKDGKPARFYGTNWYSRQSFPVFVRNLFEYFGHNRASATAESYRPGQAASLEVAAAEAKVRIKTPSGAQVDLKSGKSGKMSFTETSELGIYEVQSSGKTVDRFAVNLFNPAESDIRPNPSPSITLGDVVVKGAVSSEASRKEIWKVLVLIGLAILAGEWYIYNHRIY